jgi:SAM-dependent methyltransferase
MEQLPAERDRLLAEYYDLEYASYDEDLGFYVQYALAMDPAHEYPLLELGCGTGRVAVALAEAGFRVTAVDVSPGMLDVCRASALARGVSDRVTAVQADMRDLGNIPPGPYNLAYCAINTFAHLLTTEDQLAMLGAVRARLVQHGLLILDITPPLPHLMPPTDGDVMLQGTYPASDGALVHKTVAGWADPSTQTHLVTLFYDRETPDGTITRTSQTFTLRWAGRYEMELLLRVAGYTLEKLYGDYDLNEYGEDSERMIFVART